jgi:glutamate synthase domain-containing protein 2
MMAVFKCQVCDYLYDEDKEGVKWKDLPDDWVCPICESNKSLFEMVEELEGETRSVDSAPAKKSISVDELLRSSDVTETLMADIRKMAESGQSVIEPMKTKNPVISWDDILIKGAQLAKIPLNHEDQVNTQTIIGPNAQNPLIIESPVYVSHMSFGALSKEAKISLAKGSAAIKTAMCSGEGGILPDSIGNAYKYIFEYVPNKYSVTDENLKKADAIEIKIGQSAKPGMGGHLPGDKVTEEIAKIRGFEKGVDILSPAHFIDILTKDDLKRTVNMLRETSGGRPIGIKFAAGNIESDLEVALYSEPDFITIDGRAGATGAAPKFVKGATSVPTIFALHRKKDRRGFSDNHRWLSNLGGFCQSTGTGRRCGSHSNHCYDGNRMSAISYLRYRKMSDGNCDTKSTSQRAIRYWKIRETVGEFFENFNRRT